VFCNYACFYVFITLDTHSMRSNSDACLLCHSQNVVFKYYKNTKSYF